jgi:hypothetical protein
MLRRKHSVCGTDEVCGRCGARLRPPLRFCTECGQVTAPVMTYADLTRPLRERPAAPPVAETASPPEETPAAPVATALLATPSAACPGPGRSWRDAVGGIVVFAILIALLVAAGAIGAVFRATSAPLPVLLTTLARDSTPDFVPIDQTRRFPPTADAFHLTFFISGAEPEDELKAVWIAVDVGDAAPRNARIDEATTVLGNREQAGAFRLQRGAAPWPVGEYKVELYVNGRLAQTLPFRVEE